MTRLLPPPTAAPLPFRISLDTEYGITDLLTSTAYNKLWVKAYEAKRRGDKEQVLKYVREATKGFVGTTDMPTLDFIPEMLELYPDARVVLVGRDPERWAKSVAAVGRNVNLWWLAYVMWPIPGWRWFPGFIDEFKASAHRFTEGHKPLTSEYDLLVSLLSVFTLAHCPSRFIGRAQRLGEIHCSERETLGDGARTGLGAAVRVSGASRARQTLPAGERCGSRRAIRPARYHDHCRDLAWHLSSVRFRSLYLLQALAKDSELECMMLKL